MTLREYIERAERQRRDSLRYLKPAEVIPFMPAWRRRLEARDETSRVLVNGAWTPGDGGVAA